MGQQGITSSASGMLEEIKTFIATCKGLKARCTDDGLEITQILDAKVIKIKSAAVEQVLTRSDQDGKPFLQLNLSESKKIIITDNLIGFKPLFVSGLDLKQLPRVVTTPDLISVLEAYEDVISESPKDSEEPTKLKLAFNAIIKGGEDIGFDLTNEKHWLIRLAALTNCVDC